VTKGPALKYFASLLLLALIVVALAAYSVYAPFGPAADANPTYVDIAPGTGTMAIAYQLEHAGIIRSRFAFDLLRAVKGGKLLAGEYRFDHPAPATQVYARILRGDVYTVALTIPEGYNIFDIAQAVQSVGLVRRDEFLRAELSRTDLISDLSPNAPSLEGYLFPDTYRFSRHATPAEILGAMVKRFRKVAAQLGLSNQPVSIAGLALGPAQKVVLASLIEKEVADPTERPLVASVFQNRLATGMPLATDPSVIYAALLDGRYRGTIYVSDLKFQSPYNTYIHTGLPPGPICNPGIAALKAAISPARTDFLYFVADAQGHSRFSATLKEHAQQVQTYRRALRNPAR
jgi:UPF0755 protein